MNPARLIKLLQSSWDLMKPLSPEDEEAQHDGSVGDWGHLRNTWKKLEEMWRSTGHGVSDDDSGGGGGGGRADGKPSNGQQVEGGRGEVSQRDGPAARSDENAAVNSRRSDGDGGLRQQGTTAPERGQREMYIGEGMQSAGREEASTGGPTSSEGASDVAPPPRGVQQPADVVTAAAGVVSSAAAVTTAPMAAKESRVAASSSGMNTRREGGGDGGGDGVQRVAKQSELKEVSNAGSDGSETRRDGTVSQSHATAAAASPAAVTSTAPAVVTTPAADLPSKREKPPTTGEVVVPAKQDSATPIATVAGGPRGSQSHLGDDVPLKTMTRVTGKTVAPALRQDCEMPDTAAAATKAAAARSDGEHQPASTGTVVSEAGCKPGSIRARQQGAKLECALREKQQEAVATEVVTSSAADNVGDGAREKSTSGDGGGNGNAVIRRAGLSEEDPLVVVDDKSRSAGVAAGLPSVIDGDKDRGGKKEEEKEELVGESRTIGHARKRARIEGYTKSGTSGAEACEAPTGGNQSVGNRVQDEPVRASGVASVATDGAVGTATDRVKMAAKPGSFNQGYPKSSAAVPVKRDLMTDAPAVVENAEVVAGGERAPATTATGSRSTTGNIGPARAVTPSTGSSVVKPSLKRDRSSFPGSVQAGGDTMKNSLRRRSVVSGETIVATAKRPHPESSASSPGISAAAKASSIGGESSVASGKSSERSSGEATLPAKSSDDPIRGRVFDAPPVYAREDFVDQADRSRSPGQRAAPRSQ